MTAMDERSDFQGLFTNLAESKAPPGALVEAQNVVIRRPRSIEPRDGVVLDPNLNGSELVTYSYAGKDYLVRDAIGPFRHSEAGGATITPDLTRLRRDIDSRAEARGILYQPTGVGVKRLLPNATAWENSGLPIASVISSGVPGYGYPAPYEYDGLGSFSATTLLQLPAGQGPVPSAAYWFSIHFNLDAMPAGTECLVSRTRGTGATLNGYQFSLYNGFYRMRWFVAGVATDVSFAIPPSDVSRAHVVTFTQGAGTGRLYVDGVQLNSGAGAPPTSDPLDVLTMGNIAISGAPAEPLRSATLIAFAGGTGTPSAADVLAIYDDTKLNGDLSTVGVVATNKWYFSQLPPLTYIGAHHFNAVVGPAPAFAHVAAFYPGDVLPEDYPPELWFPRGYHVNYRLVGYSQDATGLIRRSAPSAAYEVTMPADAGTLMGTVSLTISGLRTPMPYPYVEIYRSRAFPIGTTIDDEMQLVGRVDSGFVVFLDTVPQESRGATLYTSPSRGGIIQANDQPPACALVVRFKGALFFGNTRGPATQVLSFNADPTANIAGQANGIGLRLATATLTAGSAVAVLGSAAMNVGLQPGMEFLSTFGATFRSTIVSIAGVNVTLAAAPTAPAAGAGGVEFRDTVWFGGTNNYAYPWALANVYSLGGTDFITVSQIVPSPEAKDYTFAVVSDTRAPVAAPYTIRATHGPEYVPPLPLFLGTPKLWEQDVFPGGIYWSKTDEPEHVPALNFAFVGDQRNAMLGLVATRDAIYVLKEDGIWRLTGVNGVWRIDPFDPTTICVLPNSVRPLFGRGCFLSRKGVVCVGDAGVELVSGPVNDILRPIVDGIQTRFLSSGLYELNGVLGSCAAVFERENEYTLLTGATLPLLVFNQNTGAWTAWKYDQTNCVAVNRFSRSDKLVYSVGSPGGVVTALSNYIPLANSISSQYRADRERAVTISSFDAALNQATLSASPGVTFAGDILIDAAGQVWIQTANSSTAVIPVKSTATGAFAPGAGFLFRALRCRVVPAAFIAPASLQKHYRAVISAFPVFVGGTNVRIGYQSSMDPVYAYEDMRVYAPKGYVDAPMGYQNSALVPRGHARAWNLHAAIEWSHAFGNARLEGVFGESTDILPDSPNEVVAP
jgi:hypothetical protein